MSKHCASSRMKHSQERQISGMHEECPASLVQDCISVSSPGVFDADGVPDAGRVDGDGHT